jgi:hypothetical protein
MPDPGRPSYEEFYSTLGSVLPFDIHFGADFPEDMVMRYQDRRVYRVRQPHSRYRLAVCNMNVVVMMRTFALAQPMLTRSSVSALSYLCYFRVGCLSCHSLDHPQAFLPLPDLPDAILIPNPSITNLTLSTHSPVPPPSLSNTDLMSQTNRLSGIPTES